MLDRAGVDPGDVEQLVGGCVTTANEQSSNVTRNAWLGAGLPPHVGATTVDCACGSGQANAMVSAMISAGMLGIGIGRGVESMSTVALHSRTEPAGVLTPRPPGWPQWDMPAEYGAASGSRSAAGLPATSSTRSAWPPRSGRRRRLGRGAV